MQPDDILTAYAELEQARRQLFVATEAAIQARDRLEGAKREARREGKIQGKNETEREDSARALLPEHYQAVDRAEFDERGEKFLMEQQLAKVEMVRALLRLEELNARVEMKY